MRNCSFLGYLQQPVRNLSLHHSECIPDKRLEVGTDHLASFFPKKWLFDLKNWHSFVLQPTRKDGHSIGLLFVDLHVRSMLPAKTGDKWSFASPNAAIPPYRSAWSEQLRCVVLDSHCLGACKWPSLSKSAAGQRIPNLKKTRQRSVPSWKDLVRPSKMFTCCSSSLKICLNSQISREVQICPFCQKKWLFDLKNWGKFLF